MEVLRVAVIGAGLDLTLISTILRLSANERKAWRPGHVKDTIGSFDSGETD
jgi:hypothetical protein